MKKLSWKNVTFFILFIVFVVPGQWKQAGDVDHGNPLQIFVNDGVFLANCGGISRSTDTCRSWNAANTGRTEHTVFEFLTHKESIYARGSTTVSRSDDNGITWQNVVSGFNQQSRHHVSAVIEGRFAPSLATIMNFILQ